MRHDRVRRIVIVTDFIGSGKRVWEMLEAFRSVATLRSWRSYHLLRFHVVAYSGTEDGLHGSFQPVETRGTTVMGCPTFWNTFSGARRAEVLDLCKRYPPGHRHPYGFSNGGALIAFAHGMPNNAPPILHSRARRSPTHSGGIKAGARKQVRLDYRCVPVARRGNLKTCEGAGGTSLSGRRNA